MSDPMIILNLILLAVLAYVEWESRRDRRKLLDFIDRLQNKLMARDYAEYSRPPTGGKIKNPVMERIKANLEQRSEGDE